MKTTFTFLLLMIVAINSYSQKTSPVNQKSETFSSGINTDSQQFSITKVYPNPVTDFVTVDLHSEVSATVQLNLFNILGTEVKKWEPIYTSQGDQKIKIDLSFVKTGVYILKIFSSGQTCTQVLKKI
ncbi:MAG TPA: T9SS type A sorting domain-containing protein [Prolixibacteraceae bacterium]|nr:T9SS type A sorting domain-containing protein [Prolixibacteraceae bacterium]